MKIKLLLVILSISAWASAQSLSIASVDSSKCTGNALTSHDLESHIIIHNNTTKSIDVKVKRIDKNYNALTDSNAICWVICFLPDVSQSPQSITLAGGANTSMTDFVGHVYPDRDDVSRSGAITYVFFNANDPNDSVAHTINYSVVGTIGLEEEILRNFKVFPNPATNQLNIKFDGINNSESTFELSNMVGTRVYSKKLSNSSGNFSLDISRLPRGVYFYTLKSSGKVLTTKKLIIR